MFCCQRSLLNLAFCRGNLNGLIGSAKGGSVVGAVNCELCSATTDRFDSEKALVTGAVQLTRFGLSV